MIKTEQITGEFDWIVPQPKTLVSYVQGNDAEAVYESVKNVTDGVWYDSETKTMQGSNPFISAKVDSLIRPLGMRVANLRDLSRPEVMELVKGKFYSDTPVLVLRTRDDSYERNKPLINRIIEIVEDKEGKLKLPLMITGFDVDKLPKDTKGYGLTIVPRDDFTIISDGRLAGKYHRRGFSEVDELGLPLFDENGERIWYARDKGLSGLGLGGNLGLDSRSDFSVYSYEDGRVVLVSDEHILKERF